MKPPFKSKNAYSYLGLFFLLLMFWVIYIFEEDSKLELHGEAMGTTWNVVVIQKFDSAEKEFLSNQIITLIEEIEAEASHWREDSILSRFNRASPSTDVELSPHLTILLEEANRLNSETLGALDITLLPLIKAWGFGPEGRPKNIPTEENIQNLLKRVGHDKFKLSLSSEGKKRLSKSVNGAQLDFSSIGKGYVLDRIGDLLGQQNLSSWYLEFGGEIKTRGSNSKEQPWRVGLEEPNRQKRNKLRNIIELQNLAVATSGDYRNYYSNSISNEKIFSHILDPRTARPLTHHTASVSVVHESALVADGLATALMVLGSKEGFKLASEKGWAASFVIRKDGNFVEQSTQPFKAYIID